MRCSAGVGGRRLCERPDRLCGNARQRRPRLIRWLACCPCIPFHHARTLLKSCGLSSPGMAAAVRDSMSWACASDSGDSNGARKPPAAPCARPAVLHLTHDRPAAFTRPARAAHSEERRASCMPGCHSIAPSHPTARVLPAGSRARGGSRTSHRLLTTGSTAWRQRAGSGVRLGGARLPGVALCVTTAARRGTQKGAGMGGGEWPPAARGYHPG